MSQTDARPEESSDAETIAAMRRANSEAFSIIGTELAEVKAVLMALLDLQKSSLLATGVSERELEQNVQTLIEGYRAKYLAALSQEIKAAVARS